MRAFVSGLALLLAATSAAAATLIVLPAPTKTLAFVAVLASERSAFLAGGGALAVLVLLMARGPSPFLAASLVLLAVVAMSLGALPIIQARQLARARGVSLDFGRYLHARLDTEGPGAPDRTVSYATFEGPPSAGERPVSPAPEAQTLTLDVYLPHARPATPTRPILVIHGGFWSAGKKGEAALTSRRLADRGFTVFDVDYRLAPQPNWKAAVGDVKCAIRWIKAHASNDDWNVEPNKLAVLGRSAGGHLALMAAYTANDSDLPASCESGDSSVDAVIAFYAPTDLEWAYEYPSNSRVADSRARTSAFLGATLEMDRERWRALSPVARVTARSPRTLLLHGGRDQFIRPEHVQLLASRLRTNGVPFQTVLIPYAQHAFDFVVGGFSSQLSEAALIDFLRDG